MHSIYIKYTSINRLSKAGAALVNTISSMICWCMNENWTYRGFERNVIYEVQCFEIQWRYDPRTCWTIVSWTWKIQVTQWDSNPWVESPEFFRFMRQLLKLSSKCEDHIFIGYRCLYVNIEISCIWYKCGLKWRSKSAFLKVFVHVTHQRLFFSY